MAVLLVIGKGAREHAIAWKLSQSPKVKRVYVSPGNVFITNDKIKMAAIDLEDHTAICNWCTAQSVSMVVVGPAYYLSTGIPDSLNAANISCFGPTKKAAQIELDKVCGKLFMDRYHIPTARWNSFNNAQHAKDFILNSSFPGFVVKASGPVQGRGVIVAANSEEACNAVDEILTEKKFGLSGSTVVIEERLEGEEASILSFCDGSTVKVMIPAQDHKRLQDGDKGPNTAGMGAYCPCPFVDEKQLKEIEEKVLKRAVEGLKKDGSPFVGILYAGLMMTKEGPRVLEFNARFGDPETQVLLPLLENDLYEVMMACCRGELLSTDLHWKKGMYAVGVVMASRGFPDTSTKGCVITGVAEISAHPDHFVFLGPVTSLPNGNMVTDGGKVLTPVVVSSSLADAAHQATKACKAIQFDGCQYRNDIAFKGICKLSQ